MEQYIGEGEYDFDILNNLPSKYMEYIDGLMRGATITEPDIDQTSYDIGILKDKGDRKSIYALMGGKNQIQYLRYNYELFLFHMIPMSMFQRMIFSRRMFMKYFADDVTEKLNQNGLNIDLNKVQIEPRKMLYT